MARPNRKRGSEGVTLLASGAIGQALAEALKRRGLAVRTVAADGALFAADRIALASRLPEAGPLLVTHGHPDSALATAIAAGRVGRTPVLITADPTLAGESSHLRTLGIASVIDPITALAAEFTDLFRGPIANALGSMRRGGIHVEHFTVEAGAPAVGVTLRELTLPAGSRVAGIVRGRRGLIPGPESVLRAGDDVVLVGNTAVLAIAARQLGAQRERSPRFALAAAPRLSEPAAGLRSAMATLGLNVGSASAIGSRWPRLTLESSPEPGVPGPFALALKRAASSEVPAYRISAMDAIAHRVALTLPAPAVRRVGALLPGELDVFMVVAGENGTWINTPLCEIRGLKGWSVLAVEAAGGTHVPHPDDALQPGETVVIAGPPSRAAALTRGLAGSARSRSRASTS